MCVDQVGMIDLDHSRNCCGETDSNKPSSSSIDSRERLIKGGSAGGVFSVGLLIRCLRFEKS